MREACHKFAFGYLMDQKKTLSKGKNINYDKLQTQSYLLPGSGLSQDDVKQIYLLRTQNVMVKANFPGMFKDDKCVMIQCNERETSEHIFSCKYLNDEEEKCLLNEEIQYNDINSNNIFKQLTVKNIFLKKFKQREKILSSVKIQ